ncbi:MAG: type II toxin-antitoxin system HicA family toxin [Deltaproteobacteria bacterium]|nr:type II toxin-antitoxin system HicA family toxin [Deltaproteobacteria bacterium]
MCEDDQAARAVEDSRRARLLDPEWGGKGSHVVVRCGDCVTTVPADREIAPGTLRSIENALAACLGKKWLKG